MEYKELIDKLLEKTAMFQKVGATAYNANLNKIIAFSDFLGNPEKSLKCIHVAGTNGKGSTSHLIASILQTAGYKVGLFTSPHFNDIRERIKINGNYIPELEVLGFLERTKDFVENQRPSFFELMTAMAFSYFHEQKVDYAVIEVGMGGRLDATNIINPILSVITNIDYDHEQFLGNTKALIAGEKAGIIKNKVPVVIGQKDPETDSVFSKKAYQNNADIYFPEDDYNLVPAKTISYSSYKLYEKGSKNYKRFTTELFGNYQVHNIRTAIYVANILRRMGLKIYDSHLKKGVSEVKQNTNFFGRWEVIHRDRPRVIIDSAHNPQGLKYVGEYLLNNKFDSIHIVFGMVNDKSPEKLLSVLPQNATFYFCKANLPRGLDVDTLQNAANKLDLKSFKFNSVEDAYNFAYNSASKKGVLFVLGSIFVAAEVFQYIASKSAR